MSQPTRRRRDEKRGDCDEKWAVGAEAVLLEWLAAMRGRALPDAAALHDWARREPAAFRLDFAAFAGLDPADPRLEAAVGWLLGAGVRPDDRVRWTGDPGDPWLCGRFITGAALIGPAPPGAATIVLERPMAWPPPRPVRRPASSPDAR